MVIDTIHIKKCNISDIVYELLLCVIWVIYAYNVMFNLGTGMENVTDLKNRTLFQYGAFKSGPASEP